MHFTDEHSFDVVKTVAFLITFLSLVQLITVKRQPLNEILIYS